MSWERLRAQGSAAEIYDKFLVPPVFGPWANILVEAAGVRAGDRIVDVACGTGVSALCAAAAASPGGVVTGIDLNRGRIAAARAKVSPRDVKVEWRVGDASELPIADKCADAVICQLGLQFFPDRPAALSEMKRVLVPKGRLALLVWRDISHSPGFAALATSLERNIGAEAGAVMRGPFTFGDHIDPLYALHRDAGFKEVKVRSEVRMVRFASSADFVGKFGAATSLAPHLEKASDASIDALLADVSEALGNYADGENGIAFPIEGNLVTARV